jgi:hypothetical protein
MKIRPVGAELFPVDRRTERRTGTTKFVVAHRTFVNASQNMV